MSSDTDELRARYEGLHTEDISRKMQFGPEYVYMIGRSVDKEKTGNITLLHSVRDASFDIKDIIGHENIDDIIEYEIDKGHTVFEPQPFSKKTDEVMLTNTARYVINISNEVIVVYADDARLKVGYGMAIGKNKPTLVLYPELDIKAQLTDWDRTQAHARHRIDDRIIPDGKWSDYEKKWSNFISFTPACIELEYNITHPGQGPAPELTTFGAVTFGILLSTNKPFVLSNLKEVQNAAMLEKESGQIGYSTVALRLHEWYNKK